MENATAGEHGLAAAAGSSAIDPMRALSESEGLNATQVARLCGVNTATVTRWVLRGTAGQQLEAWKVGGEWRTTREAVSRFITSVTARRKQGVVPGRDGGGRSGRAEHVAPLVRAADPDRESLELSVRYGMQ